MRNHRLYEVKLESNREVGGWKIVTGKGNCVKRTTSRREAVTLARSKARVAAEDFGVNTTLRVRNSDGTVSEERSYTATRF